jgi:hypothetical protein
MEMGVGMTKMMHDDDDDDGDMMAMMTMRNDG